MHATLAAENLFFCHDMYEGWAYLRTDIVHRHDAREVVSRSVGRSVSQKSAGGRKAHESGAVMEVASYIRQTAHTHEDTDGADDASTNTAGANRASPLGVYPTASPFTAPLLCCTCVPSG